MTKAYDTICANYMNQLLEKIINYELKQYLLSYSGIYRDNAVDNLLYFLQKLCFSSCLIEFLAKLELNGR